MHRFLHAFVFLVVMSSGLLAQPINNLCFDAIPFSDTCSAPGFFSNIDATESIISPLPPFQTPACWNGSQRDVWFTFFTTDTLLDVEITVSGSPDMGTIVNPQIALYRGGCDPGIGTLLLIEGCIAASPGSGEATLVVTGLEEFSQYFIRVNDYSLGAGSNEGTFQLCVIPYEGPTGIDCNDPVEVLSLPFSQQNMTTCGLENTYTSSPCNTDTYLSGEDIVFTYTPSTNECVNISVTNTSGYAGIHVFTNCPDAPGACVGSAVSVPGNPTLNQLQLNANATYYIVVSTNAGPGPSCTDFNISITNVPCPPPTAADAVNAFPLCQAYVDAFGGNPCFQTGGVGNVQDLNIVNRGCFFNNEDDAFWFYVTISAPGQFMFTASMNPASDVDFNVWGPFTSFQQALIELPTAEPIRSSWAGGSVPTGLINFHPVTGLPILDTWDCQGNNDSWVMPIDVQVGEVYLVLLDDWINQSIGCMSVDFSNSTCEFSCDDLLAFYPLNDTLVCAGELLSIGDPDFPLPPYTDTTIVWSPASGLSCTDCPNPQVIPSQSTFYVWTVTNDLFSISDTVFIDVITEVVATTNIVTTDICQGESVQLSAAGGTSFLWSPSMGLSCTDCPNPVAMPTDTITYMVEVSAPCGIDTAYVTINTQAAMVDFGTDIIYLCKNETQQLNIATAGSGGSGLSISPQIGLNCYNCTDPVFDHNSTVTYVASFNTAGCTVYDTLTVRIDSLPQANFISDSTICAGEFIILSYTQLTPQGAYPDIQFQWSPPPSPPGVMYISSNTQDNNIIVILNETTTFIRTMTQNACSQSDTVTITVEQASEITITPSAASICPGQPVSLSATSNNPDAEFTWSPSTGLSCTDCPNPVASPMSTTTYTVESGSGNCAGQATITIEIVEPELELISDTQICEGESIQIGVVNDPNTSYSWVSSTGVPVPAVGNPVVTPNQTTTYTLTATQGDCSVSESVTITVLEFPDITISSNGSAFCEGETVELTANAQVSTAFVWTGDGLQSTTGPVVTAVPPAPGTYTYNVKVENNGCDAEESITITVDEEPEIDLADDVQICPGQTVVLGNIHEAGVTYTWTASTGESVSPVGNPTVNPAQTTTYELTAVNGACQVTGAVTITVQPLSVNAGSDQSICAGQSVQLSASGQNGNTWSWSPSIGLSCTDCANPLASPAETTTYTVTYSLDGDCTVSNQVTVIVGSNLLVTIAPDTVINQGATVQLSSQVLLVDGSEPGELTYSWSPAEGLSCTDCPDPDANPNSTTTYVLTVTSSLGCTGTSNSIMIVVDLPLYAVPSAFTPDGDDMNDHFNIYFSEGANVVLRNFRVFNRWGQLVYNNTSPGMGWDGRHNGNPAPQDVYVYVIELEKADGTIEVIKGDLTLLR